MKYYIVADPHGYCTALKTALAEKGFFEEKGEKKLIVCGDLFDRGFEAKEMQEFIVDLLRRDEAILIRGNHEDLMENLVDEAEKWLTPAVFNTHHFVNGTVDTLLQLTGMGLQLAILYPERAAKRMRETPLFKKILPATVDYFETERYIFVHGWLPSFTTGNPFRPAHFSYRTDWRNATQEEWKAARWYNGMHAFACKANKAGKTVVCGHYRASFGHAVIEGKGSQTGEDADHTPFYGQGIVALDAFTAISGRVNCIVLEE